MYPLNQAWIDVCPISRIDHLAKACFEHIPILLSASLAIVLVLSLVLNSKIIWLLKDHSMHFVAKSVEVRFRSDPISTFLGVRVLL